jgi:RNA polymerase sigma-70 factor (ECF subfamily)
MASDPAAERPDANYAAAAQRDGDIVADIKAGHLTRAFEQVMQRYEAKVFRLCLTYFRDSVQAQDAAQESLVRVWRALSKYDGRASLSTWIYAITRNWCLTSLSGKRHTVSMSEEAIQSEVDSLAVPDLQEGIDQAHTIRQLVEELPEMTRRIVALYYFEEAAVSAVSELVGLPEGTVKTHLFRARSRLLARLQALGLADPAAWTA